MPKILVTGASGLLGSNLCLQWDQENDVLGTYHHVSISLPRGKAIQMSLEDEKLVQEVIGNAQPDIVVHCAALANVDACEKDPPQAMQTNSEGTANVAKATQNCGAAMVYISTDSVFDGTSGMYKEDDEPNPLNVYACSKLEGEHHVRQFCSRYLIIRTALYGWNAQPKLSLAEWMLSKLQSGEEVPAFEDAHFSPCLVNDMGDIILEAFGKGLQGIVHVGSHAPCSKFDFARTLAGVFELEGYLIHPTKIEESDLSAPRPRDVSLNVSKIEAGLRHPLPSVRDGLARMRSLQENGFSVKLKHLCEKVPLTKAA